MILKSSQRSNGSDLAIHLMNALDNEHVEVAQVYGTVADDLAGAFAEFEAVASGTKAKNYLYSLSINPPQPLTREQYFEAVDAIENRLGLSGQPRAVVFHAKAGKDGIAREHCHVVWSRIDGQSMKAIHLSHDKRKLMDMACELARKYDLDLPPGLKAWEEKQRFHKEQLEPTLAEKSQAEITGLTPEQRRADITKAYEQADNARAFVHALEQSGYMLARGDRRGFVVVDRFGDVHSLTRYIKGHKAKDIKAKLAALDPDDLSDVAQAKELIHERKHAQEALYDRQQEMLTQAAHIARENLKAAQQARRAQLHQKQQDLYTRQQQERLDLHAAQKAERDGLAFKIRSAVADLMRKTPGLRSVLGPLQKYTHLDPRERHDLESEALVRRHEREKKEVEREERFLSRLETRENASLERSIAKKERMARDIKGLAKQDFADAAHDAEEVNHTDMDEGDLSADFNEVAADEKSVQSDDEDDKKPSWKKRSEDLNPNRQKRGKGLGYRRDSD